MTDRLKVDESRDKKGIAYYCPHMKKSCTSCFDPGLLMKTYVAINYVSHVLVFVSTPNTTILILLHVIYIMIGWVSWQIYLWDRLLRRFFHLSKKLSVLQLYLMLKDFLRSHTPWKSHWMQMMMIIMLLLVERYYALSVIAYHYFVICWLHAYWTKCLWWSWFCLPCVKLEKATWYSGYCDWKWWYIDLERCQIYILT